MNIYKYSVAIICIWLSTVSCSDNSSGDNEDIPDLRNDRLNNRLSGKLFFEGISDRNRNDIASYIDLNTGLIENVPDSEWQFDSESFPNSAGVRFSVNPSPFNAKEFVVVAENCKFEFPGPEYSCILIQDFEGNYVNTFDLEGEIDSAKLSYNSEYLAIVRDLDDMWLSVYKRDGTFVDNVQTEIGSYAWMPNGSIVYVSTDNQKTLVFTKPYSSIPDTQIRLPEDIPGDFIAQIAVSPSGKHIAYTMINRDNSTVLASKGIPWIIDVETLQYRQLATSPEDEDRPNIVFPTWSPDEKYIFVRVGGIPLATLASRGIGYAIPIDIETPLILSRHRLEKSSPEAIPVYHYDKNSNPDRDDPDIFFTASRFYWIP
ncbi:hypothetical protein [Aquimarina algicola]|uniref:Dipeptidylpeptidase IV N-terminal domain-containing protein n=1 Tax=Aquimarina algicola TaxID=2589995 RepID=A0A504JQ48_9FLAO|nr:hypothetical protein [Aquimarina algicola]TPN88949.1 hypothetical protein FHK87_01655 [Aquimarina algicola]